MGFLAGFFRDEHITRVGLSNPFWADKRNPFFIAVTVAAVALQLLFLINMWYMHGSTYQSTSNVHNLNVLMVDYDGGDIGQSLRAAVAQLSAPTFPGISEVNRTAIPDIASIVAAVRTGDYWAAIYTHQGASQRLAAALGGGPAARSYNASDVVTWVYNEVRYSTIEASMIQSNMQLLVSTMITKFDVLNGYTAAQTLNTSDSAAVRAFLQPAIATITNIQPFEQGPRVFYNTVSMVMPIIMQFFFIMALNGISMKFMIYSHLPRSNVLALKMVTSLVFDFIGALCMTGYIWTYDENWSPTGSQFVLTWMILWLYMHINFCILYTASTYIPMQWMPFLLLSWIIANVTSTIYPFELSNGFYKWGYALPAHEVWLVEMQIWGNGAYNRLYIALPILFSWWAVGLVAMFFAMHSHCNMAAFEVSKRQQPVVEDRKDESDMPLEEASSNERDRVSMA